jgi:hypothetical protein
MINGRCENDKFNKYGFGRCKNLDDLDMSGWDASKMVNVIDWKFCGKRNAKVNRPDTVLIDDPETCQHENLEDFDMSGWDFSKVKNMSEVTLNLGDATWKRRIEWYNRPWYKVWWDFYKGVEAP